MDVMPLDGDVSGGRSDGMVAGSSPSPGAASFPVPTLVLPEGAVAGGGSTTAAGADVDSAVAGSGGGAAVGGTSNFTAGPLSSPPSASNRRRPGTAAALAMDRRGQDILQIAQRMHEEVSVKDRTHRLRTYKRVFVAKHAVAWLLSSGFAASTHEAVTIGDRLLQAGLIHHCVDPDQPFENSHLFFRWLDDAQPSAPLPHATLVVSEQTLSDLSDSDLEDDVSDDTGADLCRFSQADAQALAAVQLRVATLERQLVQCEWRTQQFALVAALAAGLLLAVQGLWLHLGPEFAVGLLLFALPVTYIFGNHQARPQLPAVPAVPAIVSDSAAVEATNSDEQDTPPSTHRSSKKRVPRRRSKRQSVEAPPGDNEAKPNSGSSGDSIQRTATEALPLPCDAPPSEIAGSKLLLRFSDPVVGTVFRPLEVVSFDTEWFQGKMVLIVRRPGVNLPEYFRPKRRMFELQLQGRFKKQPRGTLFFGGEILAPMHMGSLRRSVCGVLLRLISSFGRGLHFSFGEHDPDDRPHIVFPLLSAMDCFAATPLDDTPPELGTELPQVPRPRPSSDGSSFDLEHTYTFSVYTHLIDMEGFQLCNVPGLGTVDLSKFWAAQIPRLLIYSVCDASPTSSHLVSERDLLLAMEVAHADKHSETFAAFAASAATPSAGTATETSPAQAGNC
eukprot:m.118694 g.118694  ORF g.118694 m.118694 type:complete len:672 (-) comp16438_c0_seq4:737-2752(-)